MIRNFTDIKIILIYLSLLTFSCQNPNNENVRKPMIFNFNIHEGFTSMDPAFAKNQSNIWIINQIFNGLVELDENMNVVPSIAHKWDISEDGKIYTFYLRENIYFHENELFPKNEPFGNTRAVTAHDFVYSFNRIIDPQVASTGAWIFNNKVLKNSDGSISDTCFKAINDFTLRIYLQEQFPPFLEILTMPYASVVPHEVAEKYGKDFREHPVGTGPFKFNFWNENSMLALEKNSIYWKKDEKGERLPYLDAIKVSFVSDKKVAFLNFTKGNFDFFSGLDDNSKDIVLDQNGEVKEAFAGKFNFEKIPYLNTEYLGMYLDKDSSISKKHPFQDVRIRKALNHAIDRNEIVEYIRNGVGKIGDAGMVPNALPSFSKEKVKGYSYSPEKALTLLKEAGYPNGKGLPELRLYTQANSQYTQIAELIQKHFEEIGVKMTLEINQFSTHQEMVDNGKINFFRGSWLGDYADAENYLALFYGKNFSPSGPNKTHFKNEEFDRLYQEAMTINNSKMRWSHYQKMDSLVVEHAPIIVLYYDEVVRLTQKKVKGIRIDAMNSLKLEKVTKDE